MARPSIEGLLVLLATRSRQSPYLTSYKSHRCKVDAVRSLRVCIIIIGVVLGCGFLRQAQAEGVAPVDKTSSLTVCASPKEVVNENVVSFDFGEWPMWDNSLTSKAWEGIDGGQLWKTGSPKVRISHVFELQNRSDKPLTLSRFDVQGQIEEIKSPDVGDLPFQIKPQQKIHLEVFFIYGNTYPGEVTGSVALRSGTLKEPLATLKLSARVPPMARLEPAILSFGNVPLATGAVRQLTVTFDRHIQKQMVPAPLRLISSNPNLKIQATPQQGDLMGVKVKGDSLLFPFDSNEKLLPKDLKVTFAVFIARGCAEGPVDGTISLIVVGAPMVAFVRGSQAKVQGAVVSAR